MEETATEGLGPEETARRISREESRGSAALWFSVLGSPAAWAGHLGGNYTLEEWFACSPSAQDPGRILGVPVDTFSLGLNSVMLAVAVAAGIVGLVCLRRPKPDDPDLAERARWMAFAGAVEGALFSAVIVVGYAPAFLLGTCQTTP